MPSYATDIKPLFRERDRGAMLSDYLRRGFWLLRLNVWVLPFERREA